MKWNENAQKWLMYVGDHFVYDFWDCGTVRNAFPGLSKKKEIPFAVVIENVEEGHK
jgi:hypothetical protein